jgi:hypothetical protein
MYRPTNFTSFLYSVTLFCSKICGLSVGFEWHRWNDIAIVLALFIMSLLENQISSCFITEDSLLCKTSWLLSVIKTLVSSAYKISFAPWIFNGRSLMYIRNKRGPKMEPCGTPRVVVLSEVWNLCWMHLFLSIWEISTN